MPDESVGIKAGITAKLEKRDEEGKIEKILFFFPDLDISVEAATQEEARVLAEEKAAKVKKEAKQK